MKLKISHPWLMPFDVLGWLSHGGELALQRALALPPVTLRAGLNGFAWRDRRRRLRLRVGQAAHLHLTFHFIILIPDMAFSKMEKAAPHLSLATRQAKRASVSWGLRIPASAVYPRKAIGGVLRTHPNTADPLKGGSSQEGRILVAGGVSSCTCGVSSC